MLDCKMVDPAHCNHRPDPLLRARDSVRVSSSGGLGWYSTGSRAVREAWLQAASGPLNLVCGFSLYAEVLVPATERTRLEHVALSILRPPFVHDRVSSTEDAKVLLQLLRPFADGTTAVLLDSRIVSTPSDVGPANYGILAPAAG